MKMLIKSEIDKVVKVFLIEPPNHYRFRRGSVSHSVSSNQLSRAGHENMPKISTGEKPLLLS